MTEVANDGIAKPIDPLLLAAQERANQLSTLCAQTLEDLQVPIPPQQETGQEGEPALRAAQELLIIPYERTVRNFLSVEPEKIDKIAQSRGHSPESFVEATLSLMQSYGDDLVHSSGPQVLPVEQLTLPRALAIGSLLVEPKLPEPTLKSAERIIGEDPMALGILSRLRATPAVK